MKLRGIRIHDIHTGFCNQWIQLFHGVIQCICEGVDVIVVDDFKTDIYSHTLCPIDDIFDMGVFSTHVYETYGVIVVGKHQLEMDIVRVLYGTMTCYLDVTEEFKSTFLHDDNHHLSVPPDAPLNKLWGDPAENKQKSLRITYHIHPHGQWEKHYLEENRQIECHFTHIEYHAYPHWPQQTIWMGSLLRHCPFHPCFYPMEGVLDPTLVHVIHVRLEYDAIKHWAYENHMDKKDFYNYLSEKYIQTIQQHMEGGIILVLSYHPDNRVVEYLEETKRPYHFVQKDKTKGREWNAVRDMAVAETYGNGVFIGNFDKYRMQGSTYSYFLMMRCRFQKHVLMDIERVHEEPFVEKKKRMMMEESSSVWQDGSVSGNS